MQENYILSEDKKEFIKYTQDLQPKAQYFDRPLQYFDKPFIIPDGVEIIKSEAFKYCYNIKKIIIPNTVKIIENHAFIKCGNLIEIDIPDTVTFIGEFAFYKCINLKKVKLPSNYNYTTIEKSTFSDCYSLNEVILSPNITNIRDKTFERCYDLEKINLDYVEYIQEFVFSGCYKLYTINFKRLIFLNANAFDYCANLTKVTFSKDLQVIYQNSFRNCELLNMIYIPHTTFEIKNKDIYHLVTEIEGCTLINLTIKSIIAKEGHPCTVISIIKNLFFMLKNIHDNPENIINYMSNNYIAIDHAKVLINEYDSLNGMKTGFNYGI